MGSIACDVFGLSIRLAASDSGL
ncbi:hypothetical protein Taro_043655, partial [Colocasia esculenta]|nr:hypothetical protein [Colocasia esculenta]